MTETNMYWLAQAMLTWERSRRELDELEGKIKNAVLQLGKTQTVGNVRATYSKGRKSYDYRAALALDADNPDVMKPWGKISVSYDYRQACKDLKIEDIPYTEGKPSVGLKLMG